jgi:hypothetical protein
VEVEFWFFKEVDVPHEVGFRAVENDMSAHQKIQDGADGANEQVVFQARGHNAVSFRGEI